MANCAAHLLVFWWLFWEIRVIAGQQLPNHPSPPKGRPGTPPTRPGTPGQPKPPPGPTQPTPTGTFDVTKYGAKGDGKTDDTKAFASAWQAACQNPGSSNTIIVPSGKTFSISQIQFQGPCKSNTLNFQLLGNIIAPPKGSWGSKTGEWIKFERVDNLHFSGNGQGSINGQGESWWPSARPDDNRPTAIRFSSCNNLELKGVKHVNSQKGHISITRCNHANISGLTITAPGNSVNTDGIDISSSSYVYINKCTVQTGDDCIAINGGTSNIFVSEVNCGPGHGISIGSLGENGKSEQVEAISVDHCNFKGTTNGARIKTWQGGSGFARNINFTNLNFTASDNAIVIDQFYCPHSTCGTKTSAVKISDVHFRGLHGTTTRKGATVSIKCSSSVPCSNIQLDDVNLKSTDPKNVPTAECTNANGAVITRTESPKVTCSK